MSEQRATDPAIASVQHVLGLVGAAELAVFARLAKDAQHAPDLPGRVTLSRMASGELANLDLVERLCEERQIDFFQAVTTFQGLLVDFDRRIAPSDWWERLVKTYVGYGVVLDYQRELVGGLDEPARRDLAGVLGDNGHADYVVGVLGPVVQAEAQLAARLALWGRRVVGEALGIVQRTLTDHPELLDGGRPSSQVLNRLAALHAGRLSRLGLTA